MAKTGRDKIKLESTAGTGHFYTTTKNKRTMPAKMEIIKFDPKARKHVPYKETKIKSSILVQYKKSRPRKCAAFLLPVAPAAGKASGEKKSGQARSSS